MNAIKYSTGNGEIFVSLERKESNVQICVANESDEFTSEELTSLFERFYKKRSIKNECSGRFGA